MSGGGSAGNGIHHVTALAGDPRRNLGFYARVLGLRLVKKTVNFDDPSTYHLYYGNEVGDPGTVVTFFPRSGGRRGSRGPGQVTLTALRAPTGSLEHWRERLTEAGAVAGSIETRLGQPRFRFLDPDGLALEIVGDDGDAPEPWAGGDASPEPRAEGDGGRRTAGGTDAEAESRLRGIAGVTLTVRDPDPTVSVLVELLFHDVVDEKDGVVRLAAGAPVRTFVEVRAAADEPAGTNAAGTVHHVAFRARDDAEHERLRDAARSRGFRVTEILDRQYFRSIYFREPGGVLFEIATDGPGFTADEPVDELGRGLRLPPWLEKDRDTIAAALPAL